VGRRACGRVAPGGSPQRRRLSGQRALLLLILTSVWGRQGLDMPKWLLDPSFMARGLRDSSSDSVWSPVSASLFTPVKQTGVITPSFSPSEPMPSMRARLSSTALFRAPVEDQLRLHRRRLREVESEDIEQIPAEIGVE
jgi:hypothetical protein